MNNTVAFGTFNGEWVGFNGGPAIQMAWALYWKANAAMAVQIILCIRVVWGDGAGSGGEEVVLEKVWANGG